jgi:hypothetical protein
MYTTKNEIKFPFRLHQVLEESEKQGFTHILSWLPEGDGFRILDPTAFAKNIMPRYFSMNHYKSFQRQLSLYSFKRETEGLKRGKPHIINKVDLAASVLRQTLVSLPSSSPSQLRNLTDSWFLIFSIVSIDRCVLPSLLSS